MRDSRRESKSDMASPQWKCLGVVVHDSERMTAGIADPERSSMQQVYKQGQDVTN